MIGMDNEIILFHWNILELTDDMAIFVGLHHRLDRDISQPEDILLNYSFRQSTPIKLFDEQLGHGITYSGRRYQCIGEPSDPQNLIRIAVGILFGRIVKFRYPFKEYDA